MKFVVSCDLEEYREYYRTLDDLHNFFRIHGSTTVTPGELGSTEEEIIKSDPSHLIVWKENDEIIGSAVWHETSTDEHRKGDPRDREDQQILRKLCGGKKDSVVELHEIWLRTQHRGKGYGKRFFEFFEDFVRKKHHDFIVYYTDNPAAIAICRNRGWQEDFLAKEGWYVFSLSLSS